jgi:Protein of unknown function (DUF4199)
MESPTSSSVPVTTSAVAIRYGLILGLVGSVFNLALLMTAMEQTSARWAGLLITVVGIWLAHQDFKKRNNGFMEYGQGLGIAVLLSTVSGVIGSAVYAAYIAFIDGSSIQRILDKTRADMEARGGMDDAQIDQAMEMTSKFTNPGMFLLFGVLGAAFFGLLLGLAISAITKKSRPEFE